MRKRIPESVKHPYVIRLPKGSTSPTNSIYKRFDIVKQGRAVWSSGNTVIRSSEPFILSVSVNGKIREISSKLEVALSGAYKKIPPVNFPSREEFIRRWADDKEK